MNIFKDRFWKDVKLAVEEARVASQHGHPVIVGRLREILVGKILRPSLPPEVEIGHGQLTDIEGQLSPELDVVLYSPSILPSVLHDKAGLGLFPIEAALYVTQVKSKLSNTELRSAVDAARAIRSLTLTSTKYYTTPGIPQDGPYVPPLRSLFAFDSDLKIDGMDELSRYRKVDPLADTKPEISVICVVGRGYWHFKPDKKNPKSKPWRFYKPSSEFEEILSFVAGTSNTIPGLLSLKGRPQFGKYLIEDKGGTAV